MTLMLGGDSGPAIVPGSPETSFADQSDSTSRGWFPRWPPDGRQSIATNTQQITAFEEWIRNGAICLRTTRNFESFKHWPLNRYVTQRRPSHPIQRMRPMRSMHLFAASNKPSESSQLLRGQDRPDTARKPSTLQAFAYACGSDRVSSTITLSTAFANACRSTTGLRGLW